MQNTDLTTLFLTAIIFGFSNGLSPGPALTLVISHTIQYGLKAGIKVASGPILFGLTAVPITLLISIQINNNKKAIGWISIIGAIYIAYLGLKTILDKKIQFNDRLCSKVKSFWQGAFANFSNPYSYLFWFTVGMPYIIRTKNSNTLAAVFFVAIYYFFLVFSKILIALIIAKYRSFIGRGYRYVVFSLGMIFLLFSVFTFKDGIYFLIASPEIM